MSENKVQTSIDGHPRRTWGGLHPPWCQRSGGCTESQFAPDLYHIADVGPDVELSLECSVDEDGELQPMEVDVVLRQYLPGAPAVVLHLIGGEPHIDVDPDLTPAEARELAARLLEAADLASGVTSR